MSRSTLGLCLLLSLAASRLSAQDSLPAQNSLRPDLLPAALGKPIKPISATKDSSKEARLLLHEALVLSQTGKSVEEFTEIIELCQHASQMPLTKEEARYGRDLTSWAYNKRGEVYASQAADFMIQGAEKEAAALDRQALEDFEASVKLDADRWKAVHNRAVSYGVLGLHDDAISDFTRVIALKPDYVNAWFNRAEIHFENDRLAEAIRDYSEAIRLKPEDGTIHRQRGRAYAGSNRFREALGDLDTAVQLDQDDLVSLVERGEICCRLGDWEGAASDFRTAVELDPDSAEAYRGAAWLMATCPQVKYRNTRVAVESAERALELATAQSKLDFTYLDTLAAAYANASRFPEAEHAIRKAIPQAPLADSVVLKKRLSLYANQRPFREGAVVTTRPASVKVNR